MAIAGSTAIRSKTICSRSTPVTLSTNHIGFTTTLTSDLITLSTEGALGVTLTGQSTVMNDGRNATDEFGAHLSQGRHRRDHKRIKTHVANHLISSLLCLRIATLETRKLSVLRDQDQRVNKDESSKMPV